jgi:CheY-like chemotaxis protein
MLRDKTALLVDDDMRTLFALSRFLSERGMRVLKADNGEKAISVLEESSDVDVVLMDIMMPVLDGYETMKRIRAQDRFKKLPIIALTAKAMKGDRERCMEAGASDYLPKPVDQDRLISMLRMWLYR